MVLLFGLTFARLSGLTELRQREKLLFSKSLNGSNTCGWLQVEVKTHNPRHHFFWTQFLKTKMGESEACNPRNCLHSPAFPSWGSVCCSLRNENLDPSVPSWMSHSQVLEASWEVRFGLSPTLPYWTTTMQKYGWKWGKSGLQVVVYLCFFQVLSFPKKPLCPYLETLLTT